MSRLIRSWLVISRRSFSATSFKLNGEKSSILSATPDKIRNIGIIAHIDAGKTTTTERMLYYSGITQRIGNVDEGDTVTDYLTAERERGITIQSAAVTMPWNRHRVNLIDTPGHADFTFEVIRSLRVLDGAVTILDGVAGVEAQTEKVWKQAKELHIPRIVFVNKMDREGAGFSRTVKEVVSRLGTKIVFVNIPYFVKDVKTGERVFHGVLDVLNKKLLKWDKEGDGKAVQVIDIKENDDDTAELYEQCLKCIESAVDTLGEFDESVIESFLETEDYMKVPIPVIKKALRDATIKNLVVPVLCGASFKNIGVQPLLDAVVDYLPSPIDARPPVVITDGGGMLSKRKKTNKNKSKKITSLEMNEVLPVIIDQKSGCIINNNKNLTMALAFKVITDPIRGIMVFVRIYSGKLNSGTSIIDTRTGKKIKIGKLLLMHADMPHEVPSLSAGNIGVITGTEGEIITGDTLIANSIKNNLSSFNKNEQSATLSNIIVPPPVFSVSLEPRTLGDRRKCEEALEILLREDPSLKLSIDEESGQTILSGMGELHLEIAKYRLLNDLKAKVEVGEVMVTYKETLLAPSKRIIKSSSNDNSGESSNDFKIQLKLEPCDGLVEESLYAEQEGAILLDMDNNIIIFEDSSQPEFITKALKEVAAKKIIWPYKVSYDSIINSMVAGISASLQVGGPIAKLPLHSTIVKIEKWSIPQDIENVSELLTLSRRAVLEAITSIDLKNITFLEPIMNVSVYVTDEDLGNVTQDLMSARKASITSIDEEEIQNNGINSGEDMYAAKELSEKMYVPEDPTLEYLKKSTTIRGNKVVKATSPLKEMIGYLPRLRSLTQGRGNYDMEYHGMQRVSPDRLRTILDH
ncbi:hypothetical protein PACTADRAFT_2609 [Pachysolen tannophilus NRRL Y-2460]|uniref:Ribosome-releasing factor 2, mitochondrial n=1 Tax=Pachysolen tannophilus NRRL Y-2460 TaxID=669874 RepID=A0A1E4TX45_PACTA|nr:hypothetical protein PACTADRAFT_2609 [Pachysolen tannophilus NRRL Y-2460]